MLDKSNILTVLDLKKAIIVCCRQIELDSEVYVKTDFTGLSEDVLDNPLSAERVGFIWSNSGVHYQWNETRRSKAYYGKALR